LLIEVAVLVPSQICRRTVGVHNLQKKLSSGLAIGVIFVYRITIFGA
jgi:hypothetical protein